MKTTYLIIVSLCILLLSCIEEHNISQISSKYYNEEIVIQGKILSGDMSTIYISHTQPFGSEQNANPITDAQICILGEDGYKSDMARYDADKNYYTIDTKDLSIGTKYALEVKVNGDTFQSEYLKLQNCPEIEEISYKERMDGISIHVSSHGTEKDSRYYMWTFEEDWEFHSDTDVLRLGGMPIYSEKFYQFESTYHNPYYYCWKHNTSKNIYIYSTKELNENTVKENELFKIPIDDIRISYIYSLLLKQMSLSEEAYHYYSNLERLTEDTGGLFSPMPTEIRSNITCITNPDITVRGYVFASHVTTKRIFIYESDFKEIKSEYSNCQIMRPQINTMGWEATWRIYINNYGAIAYTPYGEIGHSESLLYLQGCVDCRAVEGAPKKRPDFWPNDHE